MSKLQAIYDATQHCTVRQKTKGKSVTADACPAGGGKGEELSPAELVGAGLASCMLFMMGVIALRDELNMSGTTADVEVSMTDTPVSRIGSIELTFHLPREFSAEDCVKLEKAAEKCPIKPSLHPDIAIRTRVVHPTQGRQPECRSATAA